MSTRSPKHVVILGGSFAGLTAAYELKRELRDHVRVTVIDKNEQFVFIPSLIWMPRARRRSRRRHPNPLPQRSVRGTAGGASRRTCRGVERSST